MYNNPRIIALYDRYVRARGLPVMKSFAFALGVSLPALGQVTVQEYPGPKGHGIHDLWTDAAPNGPVWFSAQGSGHLRLLARGSGKVEFVARATGRNSGSSTQGVASAATA